MKKIISGRSVENWRLISVFDLVSIWNIHSPSDLAKIMGVSKSKASRMKQAALEKNQKAQLFSFTEKENG